MKIYLFLLLLLVSRNISAREVILFLGDSLTEGYMLPKKSAFPALVEERLRTQGRSDITVINAGSSGSTSASALSRLRWHLRAKEKPTLLFLALGANDGLRGIAVASLEKNLAQTIDLAQKEHLKVILAGMRLPPNYGKTYVQNFEAVFPRLARQKKVALMPFLLEGVAGEAALNLGDGIHPNEKGHALIADQVLKALKGSL